MAEKAQYSSGTDSEFVKRKFEDQLTDVKRSKSGNGASPTAFDSIETNVHYGCTVNVVVDSDVKPQVSAAAQGLLKGKSPLVYDHGEAKKSVYPLQSLCGICFDYKPVSDIFRAGKCNHPFCTQCICKHVATQIQQSILKVICPNPNCSVELEPEYFCHTILPDEVIVRWECARCESLIVGSEKTYCPFKDCSVLLVNDGGEVVTSAECPSCHRLFCAQCKVPWHGGRTCEEFQGCRDEKELDNKFFQLAQGQNWKKCPKCAMFVQRLDGCEHITCRCGCNFCYVCGENWEYGHLCMKQHMKPGTTCEK